MAIIVEEEKKTNAWLAVIVIAVALLVLAGGTYYLFFKKVPGIEQVLAPPELRDVNKIKLIDIDKEVKTIIELPMYDLFEEHIGEPELGVFGRPNPFQPF